MKKSSGTQSKTSFRKPSRLTQSPFEMAKNMKNAGILNENAYEKISSGTTVPKIKSGLKPKE